MTPGLMPLTPQITGELKAAACDGAATAKSGAERFRILAKRGVERRTMAAPEVGR